MDVPGFALVTGAASGIGKACARAFAVEGAAGVALLDRSEQALLAAKTEVATEIAARQANQQCHLLTLVADVTDEEQVGRAVQEAGATFGRLDYVVNAAGVTVRHDEGAAFADTSDWHRVMGVNLNGSLFVLRAAAQIMLKQEPILSSVDGRPLQRGSIVNLASVLGLVAVPRYAAYTASKHAVIGLTQSASLDYAKDGLRINAMCPGYTETPMTGSPEIHKVVEETVRTSVPMNRMGQPGEIADGVLFLAGGRSSFITGTALLADGGLTAR